MLAESEAAETNDDKEEPPSFSRIDLSAKEGDIAAAFPDFPGIKSALECTLEAGTLKVLLESKMCMPDISCSKLLKKSLHGRIGLVISFCINFVFDLAMSLRDRFLAINILHRCP